MKKILVPTDFTDAAANALEHAASLAKVMEASVVALHVVAKENEAEALREKFFAENKRDWNKQAYGLFSFPGTLAVSRVGYDPKKPSRRDAEGAVITAPRNFTAAPRRRGKTADTYFSEPVYVTIGDFY